MVTLYVVRIGPSKYLRLDGLKPRIVRPISDATRFDKYRMALGAADLTQAVSGIACNVEAVCEP